MAWYVCARRGKRDGSVRYGVRDGSGWNFDSVVRCAGPV